LQRQKEQLLQQAAARNGAEQVQNSIREAEQQRMRLNREIQQLQRANGEGVD